jgi:hypothetical protein
MSLWSTMVVKIQARGFSKGLVAALTTSLRALALTSNITPWWALRWWRLW